MKKLYIGPAGPPVGWEPYSFTPEPFAQFGTDPGLAALYAVYGYLPLAAIGHVHLWLEGVNGLPTVLALALSNYDAGYATNFWWTKGGAPQDKAWAARSEVELTGRLLAWLEPPP